MMTSHIRTTLCLIGAILLISGCKTDEEPDWGEPETPVTPDDDADNDAASYNAVRLNELNGNGDKYIELYNTATRPVDVSGMQLRKDAEKTVYVAPEGTVVAANGVLLLLANQADYATGFTSGLSAKKSVLIELLGPGGDLVDEFRNPSKSKGDVWGENAQSTTATQPTRPTAGSLTAPETGIC